MVEKSGSDGFENSSAKKSEFAKEYLTLIQIIRVLEKKNKNPSELIALSRSMLE